MRDRAGFRSLSHVADRAGLPHSAGAHPRSRMRAAWSCVHGLRGTALCAGSGHVRTRRTPGRPAAGLIASPKQRRAIVDSTVVLERKQQQVEDQEHGDQLSGQVGVVVGGAAESASGHACTAPRRAHVQGPCAGTRVGACAWTVEAWRLHLRRAAKAGARPAAPRRRDTAGGPHSACVGGAPEQGPRPTLSTVCEPPMKPSPYSCCTSVQPSTSLSPPMPANLRAGGPQSEAGGWEGGGCGVAAGQGSRGGSAAAAPTQPLWGGLAQLSRSPDVPAPRAGG